MQLACAWANIDSGLSTCRKAFDLAISMIDASGVGAHQSSILRFSDNLIDFHRIELPPKADDNSNMSRQLPRLHYKVDFRRDFQGSRLPKKYIKSVLSLRMQRNVAANAAPTSVHKVAQGSKCIILWPTALCCAMLLQWFLRPAQRRKLNKLCRHTVSPVQLAWPTSRCGLKFDKLPQSFLFQFFRVVFVFPFLFPAHTLERTFWCFERGGSCHAAVAAA